MAVPKIFRETDFSSYDLSYSNRGESMLKLIKDFVVGQLGWILVHEDAATKAIVISDVDNTAMIKFWRESGDGSYYFRYEVAHSYSDINTPVGAYRSGRLDPEYIAQNGAIVGTNKAFYIIAASRVEYNQSKNSHLLFFGRLNSYISNDPNAFIVTPQYPTESQFDDTSLNSSHSGSLLHSYVNYYMFYGNTRKYLWSYDGYKMSEILLGITRPKNYSPSSWNHENDSVVNPSVFNKVFVVNGEVDSTTKGNSMIGEYPGLYCAPIISSLLGTADAFSTLDLNGTDFMAIPSQGYVSDLVLSLGDWG